MIHKINFFNYVVPIVLGALLFLMIFSDMQKSDESNIHQFTHYEIIKATTYNQVINSKNQQREVLESYLPNKNISTLNDQQLINQVKRTIEIVRKS